MAKNNLIAGLDIGSSGVKLVVAFKEEQGGFQVVSQLKENVAGVRRGVVVEPEKVSRSVQVLMEKARQEAGRDIDSVFVNINGVHIFSTNSRGMVAVSRADQKISEEDVDRVLQAAQTVALSPNKEILDIFPKNL